jgi:hypothetical protein
LDKTELFDGDQTVMMLSAAMDARVFGVPDLEIGPSLLMGKPNRSRSGFLLLDWVSFVFGPYFISVMHTCVLFFTPPSGTYFN